MLESRISIANALELRISSTKPSICDTTHILHLIIFIDFIIFNQSTTLLCSLMLHERYFYAQYILIIVLL